MGEGCVSGLQDGHNPARGEYDFRSFASALKRKHLENMKALRPLSDEIGVTVSDLSRAMGGQMVSVGKVIALCRWLNVPVEAFYLEPENLEKSECFTGLHVEQSRSEAHR
jgi:hypothetical protein